jgi:hypothetical protein
MPVRSKRQWKFMEMMLHNPKGMKNKPSGLTPAKAKEFIDATSSYKALPETAKKKKK